MSTAQQRIDTALGSLAATAAATGCPQSQVHRMCEVSEYTRGLDTLTLSGSASGTVDLALQAGAVGDCGVSGLVTEAADAVKGIAGGDPADSCAGPAMFSRQSIRRGRELPVRWRAAALRWNRSPRDARMPLLFWWTMCAG